MNDDDDDNNNIIFIDLCAKSTAQGPTTTSAQLRGRKKHTHANYKTRQRMISE
jgi:hypothetical protein